MGGLSHARTVAIRFARSLVGPFPAYCESLLTADSLFPGSPRCDKLREFLPYPFKCMPNATEERHYVPSFQYVRQSRGKSGSHHGKSFA